MRERLHALFGEHPFGDRDPSGTDEAVHSAKGLQRGFDAALHVGSLVTSVLMNRTPSPRRAAAALPVCSLMSAITAHPPEATIISTVAPPRPEAPPVTMIVLPASCTG